VKSIPSNILSQLGIPKLHYLNHLLCIQNKDWQGALDNLHWYFDYCYYGIKKETGMIASYASLNLASLHYRFGHYESALLSIQETIRIAHQKNEHECLALALSFLFRLADRNGLPAQAETLMKKCIERAKELNMPDLLNQTQLAHAKLTATKKRVKKGDDVSDITQAIWRDIHAGIVGDASSDSQRRATTYTALLTTAATWDLFGATDLATIYERCIDGNVTSENYIVATCNLALHVCYKRITNHVGYSKRRVQEGN
jgi:ATP/maltotriose-dependent transcriptional regulator MalT